MGGITLGSQPVVSFNYGKGDVQRIKKAILYITGLCVSFCILITVVTWAASPVYVRLFTEDPEILHRSVTYIKRFTFMIIPLAIQYPLVDETTALGKMKLALYCSAFRKFIFLAGLIFLPALFTSSLPIRRLRIIVPSFVPAARTTSMTSPPKPLFTIAATKEYCVSDILLTAILDLTYSSDSLTDFSESC